MKKLLYIIFFFSHAIHAGTPFFQDHSLSKKNESLKVNVLMQDLQGYLWIGSDEGLFRFDGLKQKHFQENETPASKVTALAQDYKGRIWIGYSTGKISIMETDSIYDFEPDEGLASEAVSDMLFDRHGNLWFSTLGDGLYHYRNNRLYRYDESDNMPDLYIYDIEEDNTGRIWAGTDGGIAVCALQNKHMQINTLNYEKGIPDNIIKKIIRQGDDMLFATESEGIFRYENKSRKCYPVMQKWNYGTINSFIVKNGQIWIAGKQGLFAYDIYRQLIKQYGTECNASLTAIGCIINDREGNIWTGSVSGVVRTPGDFLSFIVPFASNADNTVHAVSRDMQGRIWIVNDHGLYRQENEGEEFVKQLKGTPYENYPFISIYTDESGTVWAGTYGKGVISIRANGSVTVFDKELTDGNVLNISGQGDEIWLATLGGATRIIMVNGEYLFEKSGRSEGLASEYIYQVFRDSKGRAWFATDGKGICMKDSKGFHNYSENLDSKVIFGFTEDLYGNIWANVQGYGICRFDGKGFIRYDIPLTDDNVSAMTADHKGNLILVHDMGIDIYHVKSGSVRYYGEHMGIRAMDPGLNAIYNAGGDMLLGTSNGIICYSPFNDDSESSPVPHIEGVKISNVPVPLKGNNEFRYNENDFTITFLGFWYQNPSNLSYSYKLDNYDKEWITGKNHFATYSSLPPGSYVFRVRTSHLEHFNDSHEAVFRFTIKPPFWQTLWFYITASSTLIVLIIAFIKFRERKLLNDKKVLEEKNEQLKKINMELDRFVYSVSHDLRAPLLSMQGVVEITEEVTEESETREHMKMLRDSISRLDCFIREILDYSRNARIIIKKELINFKQLTDEIVAGLKHMETKKPVKITTTVNDKGMFHCDRERLSVIINNLVSNSIRYHNPDSDEPFVEVHIEATETKAVISVKDNGIGIPKEYSQKIFEMFFRGSETSNGSGLGLYIVKETVEKLKGSISMQSETGEGAFFSIEIPNLFYQ